MQVSQQKNMAKEGQHEKVWEMATGYTQLFLHMALSHPIFRPV